MAKKQLKNWPAGYQQKVEAILGTTVGPDGTVNLFFPYETKAEAAGAIKKLSGMQKELRVVKKEAGAEMIRIRNEYAEKKGKVTAGFFAALSGDKAIEKDRDKRREKLKAGLLKSVEPYETVQDTIDKLIAYIDKVKHEVEADMFSK